MSNSGVSTERRRAFYRALKENPAVESADFSRDGYRTAVLELKDDPPEPVEV